MVDSAAVRAYIVANVDELPRGLAQSVAKRFSISRQAANRHISRLVDEGVLRAEGQTRNREYRLATLGRVDGMFPITEDLQEDVVWRDHVLPMLAAVPDNVFFAISSWGLNLVAGRDANEVLIEHREEQQGTRIVVSLAQAQDEKLISRSQAKRIVARLDRFKEVMLDFKGIDSIGPAFADEIFRVFRSTHPAVHLEVINASDQVQKMIRRAESAAAG